MEVPLNISRGERQQEFIDYLNSALRRRSGGYSGSAGVTDDGSFQSSVTGPFQVGEASQQLTWTLTKSADGTLTKLTVDFAGEGKPESDWERPVYEFITSVLATTLS